MRPGIPRLVLVTPLAVALAVMLAASRPSAMGGAESPALRSISSRLDGAVSTVLIEATEPVAYLTSQPDPLTVLVDLRNVAAGSLTSRAIGDVLEPVGSVRVEHATAPDGAPVARVRVNLERAATHRVRSSRNTILVEVDRVAAASPAAVRSIAPVPPAAVPAANARQTADVARTRATSSAGASGSRWSCCRSTA